MPDDQLQNDDRITALERLVREQSERLERVENGSAPVGTITAFAGPIERIPQNWLLCDGTILDCDEYPKLFDRIGGSWGVDTPQRFKIPDLRGLFLRGVDAGSGVDPDRADRIVLDRAERIVLDLDVSPNNVGSIQPDATKLPSENFQFETDRVDDHTHANAREDSAFKFLVTKNRRETAHGDTDPDDGNEINIKEGMELVPAGGHSHTISMGGGDAETRPKNAYVLWIIRAW